MKGEIKIKTVKFTVSNPISFIPEATAEHSMTVQELIDTLKTFPADSKIICSLGYVTNEFPYSTVNKEDFKYDILY